jgi:hypothetical protein
VHNKGDYVCISRCDKSPSSKYKFRVNKANNYDECEESCPIGYSYYETTETDGNPSEYVCTPDCIASITNIRQSTDYLKYVFTLDTEITYLRPETDGTTTTVKTTHN